MSESAQQPFYIYHSSLLALLQEVQGRSSLLSALLARLRGDAPAVRVESLSVRVRLLVVWGVLVTARRGDEILSAWVVADQATQPVTAERQAQARTRASVLCQRIVAQGRCLRLQVQTGSYAVPEQAFRQVATFSPEEPAPPKGSHA